MLYYNLGRADTCVFLTRGYALAPAICCICPEITDVVPTFLYHLAARQRDIFRGLMFRI
jgi:hypothetical protein